jgi:hypothetical protein
VRRGALVTAVGGTAFAAAHHLGRTYGSTAAERRRRFPGDELVERPQTVATHAVTVPAPPDQVWPWLVQMGWHRGGWYTARWVDVLLFPDNLPSVDFVVPDLQQLAVGDVIPDGPPRTQCQFTVVEVVPERRLVLRSDSHLPLSWRRHHRARLDWTWSFVLEPVSDGTRLLFRWRARTSPTWLTVGVHALVVPADFLMSRDMLRGISWRVSGMRERAIGYVGGMPARKDMPSTVQRSSKKAQRTWGKTHDSAVEQYGEGERAHRTAFDSLKHTHEKVGDHWEAKGKKGPSDAQAAKRGPAARSGGETAGGVDANATKSHLLDVARKLDVRGRSRMTKDELVEAIQKANDRETRKRRQ